MCFERAILYRDGERVRPDGLREGDGMICGCEWQMLTGIVFSSFSFVFSVVFIFDGWLKGSLTIISSNV